jgi:hypothetical protein
MAFFSVISDLKKSISKIENRLPRAAKTALKANAYELSRYNRERLLKGQKSDLSFLPNYSPSSVNNFGKQPGPIKLYDTGDFQKSIKPNFGNEAFEMEATDSKTDMLQDTYGDDILGIDDESFDDVAEDAIGQIQFELRKHLNLL